MPSKTRTSRELLCSPSLTTSSKAKKIYLVGSLRNSKIPLLAQKIRGQLSAGELVFDDWFSAGPEADDYWKTYEQAKWGTDASAYQRGLEGFAANHVFEFDKHHLDTATHTILVLPAGKSGHMEIMYAEYATSAKTAIYLEEGEDPRWDVMYKFIPNILATEQELFSFVNGENEFA